MSLWVIYQLITCITTSTRAFTCFKVSSDLKKYFSTFMNMIASELGSSVNCDAYWKFALNLTWINLNEINPSWPELQPD